MPVLEAGFPPCLKVSGSTTSRNHGREAIRRAEESKRTCTRAPPKRVGRAFALLTRLIMGVGKREVTRLFRGCPSKSGRLDRSRRCGWVLNLQRLTDVCGGIRSSPDKPWPTQGVSLRHKDCR